MYVYITPTIALINHAAKDSNTACHNADPKPNPIVPPPRNDLCLASAAIHFCMSHTQNHTILHISNRLVSSPSLPVCITLPAQTIVPHNVVLVYL
jgi:hypothetical protein